MSNESLIIPERSRSIGSFMVGRLIPFYKKRMVGPFAFIDHMGPAEFGPNSYMDVNQHPHIGLSTLTYLFEGEIEHADSMGNKQIIRPGAVNWMTSGKGVTHTERTPQALRNGSKQRVHGYQVWVALPKSKEDIDPSFAHIERDLLPAWTNGTANFTLIAGEAFGKKSPVPVYSELFMFKVTCEQRTKLDFNMLTGELGICVVKGSVTAQNEEVLAGNLLVSDTCENCETWLEADSTILCFGGEPFEEERYINWNFVASNKERIETAKHMWKRHEFPEVPNDSTYVPYPSPKKG